MVILYTAVLATSQLAELAEKGLRGGGIERRFATTLARQSPLAARNRGEDVVRVHGADDEGVATPRSLAVEAGELAERVATKQTRHAHCIHVQHAALALHLQVAVVSLRRQEEGSIDERILVIDRKLLAADHATHFLHLMRAKVGEDETARFIVAMWT